MPVAIKIDLFSLRAIREALPSVLDLLQEYEVSASFFPALGPDVYAKAGLFNRLFGATTPIGVQAAEDLRRIPERGHEVGALPWDVGGWCRLVLKRDAAWIRDQMRAGAEAYRSLFDRPPAIFAAPDFLINAETPGVEAQLGFEWALDTRGLLPYRLMNPDGPGGCPQIPVTLPRIQDLLAAGEPLDELHQVLFMESQKPLMPGHVFNYKAGDPTHLGVLEKLLVMWKGSQREPGSLGEWLGGVDRDALPCYRPGLLRRGQGGPFQAVQGERVRDPE